MIGRALTIKGIKPVCHCQQKFQSTWLFGAFSPIDGSSHLFEFPECNSINFQVILDEISTATPEQFSIIVLDNGAFHKAKKLIIPENISLIFLPPYSPELNPAEKIWWKFKRSFSNKFFDSLGDLSSFIDSMVNSLTPKAVIKTCALKYVFIGQNWS